MAKQSQQAPAISVPAAPAAASVPEFQFGSNAAQQETLVAGNFLTQACNAVLNPIGLTCDGGGNPIQATRDHVQGGTYNQPKEAGGLGNANGANIFGRISDRNRRIRELMGE